MSGTVKNSPPDPAGGGGEVTSDGDFNTGELAAFSDESGDALESTGLTALQVIAEAVAQSVDGSGDVVGPASSVDHRVATYNGTTGKLLRDGGQTIAQVISAGAAAAPQGDVVGPASAVTARLATFNGTSGKLLADGGNTVADVIAAGAAAAPQGDVVGPASAVGDNVAVFNSTTGKLVKDGGKTITQIIAEASVAPPATIAQNSFLVSGGSVTWVSAYTFRVAAAVYYIGGIQYSSIEQEVVLDAADADDDRIDVIAVDTSGVVVDITGTAAEQPSEPEIDPATQLKLNVVLVSANTAALVGATITTLFAEAAGQPTEFDWTTSGSGFNVNSTNNPKAGSKSIEGTNVAQNAYAQAAINTGIDPNDYDSLVFYIRSKATWASNRRLRFQWYTSGTARGTGLLLAHAQYGFDSSDTTNYQLIVMPMAQFAVPIGTVCNQLRVTDTNGAIGFYIDDVSIQQGIPAGLEISALTRNQADALYAPLSRGQYKTVGFTIDTGGVPAAGIVGSIQVDFAGTIVGHSLQSDASGSISIDVCKKAGTQTAPAVPNTTTDKISASAPMVLSSQQALGVTASGVSTWTTAVAQWDTLLFNVTGTPATLQRVHGWVRILITD